MSLPDHLSFWHSNGLQEKDKKICMRAVRERYCAYDVEEFGEQGHCSFTIVIAPLGLPTDSIDGDDFVEASAPDLREGGSFIVQIRPVQYALDLAIAQSAKMTYPALAPYIQGLEMALPNQLCAYKMERLHGVPFSRIQPRCRTLDPTQGRKQQRLVASFAEFIAHGWRVASNAQSLDRNIRADSPMEDKSAMLLKCTGKVGSSIISRLEKLAIELPDQRLRDQAQHIPDQVQNVVEYPVTLNHGDLIPSNILIDEDWNITGLVDWAEAEYLPFGMCLYGLEHLLGYLSPASRSPKPHSDGTFTSSNAPEYVYFDNALQLRAIFWTRLLESVPELVSRRAEIEMFRDLGVLLWYGIAWDDGAINRVVNEIDDAETVAYLRAFLAVVH